METNPLTEPGIAQEAAPVSETPGASATAQPVAESPAPAAPAAAAAPAAPAPAAAAPRDPDKKLFADLEAQIRTSLARIVS